MVLKPPTTTEFWQDRIDNISDKHLLTANPFSKINETIKNYNFYK